VQRAPGGYVLGRKLFSTDPWSVMRQIVLRVTSKDVREAGLAFIEQANDFFGAAARAHTAASKPLLLYYSFLNLAKALILVKNPALDLSRAKHGLSECLRQGGTEPDDAFLAAPPTTAKNPQVFDLLLRACSGAPLAAKIELDVPMLMLQVVTGHRLLVDADKACDERFATIALAEILHDKSTLQIWLRLAVSRTDLNDLGVSQTEFLNRIGLQPDWQLVSEPNESVAKDRIWLEQKQPANYQDTYIGLSVLPLIQKVKNNIWQTVTATPPYRRYYLHASPAAEQPSKLPQMLSSYALFFYLGSITRYRPHHFDRIIDGSRGAFVQAFVHEQPNQLLYLFASEFAERDIAKPSLA
jgi:hypothetical protein